MDFDSNLLKVITAKKYTNEGEEDQGRNNATCRLKREGNRSAYRVSCRRNQCGKARNANRIRTQYNRDIEFLDDFH